MFPLHLSWPATPLSNPPPLPHPAPDLPPPVKVEQTKRAASPGKDAPDASLPPEDSDTVAHEEECDPELEADIQTAHHAEALDVFATIELKLALLREKLYMEKMEALAWEEALVANGVYAHPIVCAHFGERFADYCSPTGIHPELIHLDEELSKRRDKRLEVASQRRTYEINDTMKRKRAAENAVWSWWKVSSLFKRPYLWHRPVLQYERDDLEVEMLSETNRKQRRLERERRALERPLPSTSPMLYAVVFHVRISLQSAAFPTSHPNYLPRSHYEISPRTWLTHTHPDTCWV